MAGTCAEGYNVQSTTFDSGLCSCYRVAVGVSVESCHDCHLKWHDVSMQACSALKRRIGTGQHLPFHRSPQCAFTTQDQQDVPVVC